MFKEIVTKQLNTRHIFPEFNPTSSAHKANKSVRHCSGLLKLDTQLSGNLPLERSVHYEEKTHV